MDEEKQLTPENVLDYTKRFLEEGKPIHPEIEKILIERKNILDSLRVSHEQSLRNRNDYSILINDDLKENKDLYIKIPVLITHLPNYNNANRDYLRLKQQEVGILVDTIIALVLETNKIRKEIIRVLVEPEKKEKPKKKKKLMDEQEKLGFENKVRDFLVIMRDTARKIEYESTRNKILSMVKTKEEKILTDNISLQLLGKKLKEAQYSGHWKKKKNAKKT